MSVAVAMPFDGTAVEVSCDSTMLEGFALEWDELLAASDSNVVFLTSGWLRAWQETLGQGIAVLFCQVRSGGQLIAAAAFQISQGVVQFAGTGPSDYSDFIVRASLDDGLHANVTQRLLDLVRRKTPRFRCFKLGRIQPDSKTLRAIRWPGSEFYSTEIGHVTAPYMEMSLVDDRLRKKSLRRHERGLERRGALACETFVASEDVVPQLDEFFFDQHVRRWRTAGIESLFNSETSREFYRRVSRRLGPTGQVRFTTIRLAGEPVAAHFGFLQAKRFIWYKPSFEPMLAKLSPGEVLIKRLLEQAKVEGATEFDFTVGDEPFKFRFASGARRVVYLHVTDSRLGALARRGRSLAGTTVRKLLSR